MTTMIARFERWVWYAFLLSVAWQTRIIVWQADPIFIEWRAATLYVSDVAMALLFLLVLPRLSKESFRITTPHGVLFGALGIFVVLSLANARELTLGGIAALRFFQYMLFFLYLRYHAWRTFDGDMSALAFILGVLAQAFLGLSQFILQHDVGIRWIGETLLRTDMRGVAVFYDMAGQKILRAYGSLPHPNVLAAYTMIALWLFVWLWIRRGAQRGVHALVWHGAFALLLLGQYLTFSRTIIAVWAASWAVCMAIVWWSRSSVRWENIQEIRQRLRALTLTALVVTIGFCALLWPTVVARMTISSSDEAVRLRVKYNDEAISSGVRSLLSVNWTGVGIGNFTSWLALYDRTLPSFLTQPAHNIYLMAYSEIGVLGLTAWLLWLGLIVRIMWDAHRHQPMLRMGLCAIVVAMLAIGSLDHFYWTLQQGKIIWWAMLALAAGKA